MIVVVAGQHRKVGKTQAMCELIAATRSASWVAVKVSPHRHEKRTGDATDTDRYLAAGAIEAHLIESEPPITLPAGENLIIESNSILRQVEPDLLYIVIDPDSEDWKPSAVGLRARQGVIVVQRRLTPPQISMLQRLCAPCVQ